MTTPAVAALRLAVAEDAFAMFLCETAGAAVLQDGLLAAPLALVNLRPGGGFRDASEKPPHTPHAPRHTPSLPRSPALRAARGAACVKQA